MYLIVRSRRVCFVVVMAYKNYGQRKYSKKYTKKYTNNWSRKYVGKPRGFQVPEVMSKSELAVNLTPQNIDGVSYFRRVVRQVGLTNNQRHAWVSGLKSVFHGANSGDDGVFICMDLIGIWCVSVVF